MYEKGKLSARLAYNWRSKYLVTVVDCCVYLPVWQKASGFLDASMRYRLNDAIELSLEGSNLLNTKTVLMQQVTDVDSPEGKVILTPNGWFQNDRRFIVGVRWKMDSEAALRPPPPPAMLPPLPPPPATQTCADGSVVHAMAVCPVPPPLHRLRLRRRPSAASKWNIRGRARQVTSRRPRETECRLESKRSPCFGKCA